MNQSFLMHPHPQVISVYSHSTDTYVCIRVIFPTAPLHVTAYISAFALPGKKVREIETNLIKIKQKKKLKTGKYSLPNCNSISFKH